MTSRTAACAALVLCVGSLASVVMWALSSSSTDPATERPADDVAAATIRQLESRLSRAEQGLRAARRRIDELEAAATDRASAAESAGAAPRFDSTADPHASWTDDELCVAATTKGDDMALFKAALARRLSAEQRARVLISLAAFRHKHAWHCRAEREALVEAADLAPATTSVGAEALMALAYNFAAAPDDRWRCGACFETVLRDAPTEELRMRGAYGLAWRHDLGDEPPAAAIEAFRGFLDRWEKTYAHTPEVQWARHRLSFHEGATYIAERSRALGE